MLLVYKKTLAIHSVCRYIIYNGCDMLFQFANIFSPYMFGKCFVLFIIMTMPSAVSLLNGNERRTYNRKAYTHIKPAGVYKCIMSK